MKMRTQDSMLDAILDRWREPIGKDFTAYRNHCYRVMNLCLAFCGESTAALDKISIAAAFHDLGIWTNHTFDYLAPSRQLAREYLIESKRAAWSDEIEAMIGQHHKLGSYTAHPDWLVEPFRKADWIDVSRGRLKFGLASDVVREILLVFPNAGFHKRLLALTWQRLKTHPLSPLPMLRL
jgi:hypothetical protein